MSLHYRHSAVDSGPVAEREPHGVASRSLTPAPRQADLAAGIFAGVARGLNGVVTPAIVAPILR